MSKNMPEVTVVAHNGEFHADDAFAVATLSLLLQDSNKITVLRTRDDAIIEKADYVVDVGGVYDPEKNRFDHHQIGGAGKRDNGIPYAAFGLVWKKYGQDVAGSQEATDIIDQRLTQPIDALDNGISICKEIFPDIRAYDISSVIGTMNPNWNEDVDPDTVFLNAVELAKNILVREIAGAQSFVEAKKSVLDAYEQSEDKRLIVLEKDFPWEKTLEKFPEPLYVITPKEGAWRIKAVRNSAMTFENRKNLPATWGGKRNEELSQIVGVSDAVFCHNKLFTAAAKSKESALKMAQIALEA